MEPAFYRGDLLFLTNPAGERYHAGDITVYKIPGADIPIVHRVMDTRDVFIPFENSTESLIIKKR
jgi:signal peptidase